jgi:2,5-diketo-D-gluconate reductase B
MKPMLTCHSTQRRVGKSNGDCSMNTFFRRSLGRLFGTYPLKGEALASAVSAALDTGYRAIDTAQMYGNEKDLGDALASSGRSPSDLYVITKVHPDNFAPGRFMRSVEQSLRDLRRSKVDLLLLHWPPIGGHIAPSLTLLEQAHRQGLAAEIGVSNYTAAMMRQAAATMDTPIATNQVEVHPVLDQSRLLAAATETGIPLCSYSSIARGEVFKHALFANLAQRYERTPAQIVLRWILQKGVVVNSMSTNPENIRANWHIEDFTLSSVDMDRIQALNSENFRVVTRNKVPWAPDWD